MTFTIPLRLPSLANHRGHWSKKARLVKEQRRVVGLFLGGHPRPPLPCVVTLTRIAPRELDEHDNLAGALKPTADEIARWLGIDDRDERVTWRYAQRRGGVRQYGVDVAVTPLGGRVTPYASNNVVVRPRLRKGGGE